MFFSRSIYGRGRIRDYVGERLPLIAESWCLVYIAGRHVSHRKKYTNYLNELCYILNLCTVRLALSPLTEKAVARLVYSLFTDCTEMNDARVVEAVIRYRMHKERMSDEFIKEAVEGWLETGAGEMMSVLSQETSIEAYAASKDMR